MAPTKEAGGDMVDDLERKGRREDSIRLHGVRSWESIKKKFKVLLSARGGMEMRGRRKTEMRGDAEQK